MGKTVSGFAEAIEAAQQTAVPLAPTDLAGPFPLPIPKGHKVVEEGGPEAEGRIPGVALLTEYKAHAKVFNLGAPDDCEMYETTLNEILNAKAILRYEDRTFTKEGDCLVAVCWLTYAQKAKAPGSKKDEDEDNADDR